MRKKLYIGLSFVLAFIVWTIAVSFIDIQAIGPRESSVGFATINTYIKALNLTLSFFNIYLPILYLFTM